MFLTTLGMLQAGLGILLAGLGKVLERLGMVLVLVGPMAPAEDFPHHEHHQPRLLLLSLDAGRPPSTADPISGQWSLDPKRNLYTQKSLGPFKGSHSLTALLYFKLRQELFTAILVHY